ncbi:hypothetical protein BKA70DRAFT_1562638 [Coprinopsis sp. MPI-PUGE-AT-0042]|nr:hypothetical protein BKA70DRAFT_1562638 [Coprinopsis sp. MPI-PUGE-AT-0042]
MLHILLLVADVLLVYRCYIMMKGRWVVWGLALILTFVSTGFMVLNIFFIHKKREYDMEYGFTFGAISSVLTNVVVSTALVIKLLKRRKESKDLVGDTAQWLKTPYRFLFFILIESASPPIVLGILSIVAWFLHMYTLQWVFLLWISLTANTGTPDTRTARFTEKKPS